MMHLMWMCAQSSKSIAKWHTKEQTCYKYKNILIFYFYITYYTKYE